MSVAAHLFANGGDNEGLFRAGILFGGFTLPTGDISKQQPTFDALVARAGCAGAADKLECLRKIPAENFAAAAAPTPMAFDYEVRTRRTLTCPFRLLTRRCQGVSALQWFPHADGTFLKEPASEAVSAGRFAKVPLIIGQFPFDPAYLSSNTVDRRFVR